MENKNKELLESVVDFQRSLLFGMKAYIEDAGGALNMNPFFGMTEDDIVNCKNEVFAVYPKLFHTYCLISLVRGAKGDTRPDDKLINFLTSASEPELDELITRVKTGDFKFPPYIPFVFIEEGKDGSKKKES